MTSLDEPASVSQVRKMVQVFVGCKWSLHIFRQILVGITRPGELARYLDAGQSHEGMQTEYSYPDLGDRLRPNEWAEQGKPVLLDKALARKKEILDNYFPSHVSDEVDRQIRQQFKIFLPRKALSEFEMRVLFQMSANDSAALIDSPEASGLGLHRALYYNEHEGYLETFRPYMMPGEEWVKGVLEKLNR